MDLLGLSAYHYGIFHYLETANEKNETVANRKFALCGQNRKFGVRVSYKAFVLADKSFSENPHSANLQNVNSYQLFLLILHLLFINTFLSL